MVFKTCKVNRTIRGESVISIGQGKMSHEKYTVYKIRGELKKMQHHIAERVSMLWRKYMTIIMVRRYPDRQSLK